MEVTRILHSGRLENILRENRTETFHDPHIILRDNSLEKILRENRTETTLFARSLMKRALREDITRKSY